MSGNIPKPGQGIWPMLSAKGVLIDLGGVVYQGDALIEGARDALSCLTAAGLPFRFLTNTTSQPLAAIAEKLNRFGIAVEKASIFTPAAAARAHILEQGLDPHFLVAPSLMEDFAGLQAGPRSAVILGDAREGFTYQTLNHAFRRLHDGAELIALAGNRFYADADGRPSLDAGAFAAALEYASGKKALVLGKPSADFFHLAAADMGLMPEEVVMIGDDAEFDVAAAVRAGLSGILVHTGKWNPDATSGIVPYPTAESADLNAAVAELLG